MGFVDLIAKYLLLCVNFVVTLLSLILIVIGSVLVYFTRQLDIPLIVVIPIVILVVGILIFIVSTFGCCGTISGTPCLLITYGVFLLASLTGNIYLAVALRASLDWLNRTLGYQLNSTLADPQTRIIIMVIEGILGCCGTTGPNSYKHLNLDLPMTCCASGAIGDIANIGSIGGIFGKIMDMTDPYQAQVCLLKNAQKTGCTDSLMYFVSTILMRLFYFLITLIVGQGVGVITAFYLAYHFRSSKKIKGQD